MSRIWDGVPGGLQVILYESFFLQKGFFFEALCESLGREAGHPSHLRVYKTKGRAWVQRGDKQHTPMVCSPQSTWRAAQPLAHQSLRVPSTAKAQFLLEASQHGFHWPLFLSVYVTSSSVRSLAACSYLRRALLMEKTPRMRTVNCWRRCAASCFLRSHDHGYALVRTCAYERFGADTACVRKCFFMCVYCARARMRTQSDTRARAFGTYAKLKTHANSNTRARTPPQ